MPVLLDYLVAQVVNVSDLIGDTFNFSKYVGLDPASTLYPQKYKILGIPKTYLKFSNPKNIFQICTLTLKSPKLIEMTPQKVKKS